MGDIIKLTLQPPEHDPEYWAVQVEVFNPKETDPRKKWVVVQCAPTDEKTRTKELEIPVRFPTYAQIYRIGWVPPGGRFVDYPGPELEVDAPSTEDTTAPIVSRRGAPGGYS